MSLVKRIAVTYGTFVTANYLSNHILFPDKKLDYGFLNRLIGREVNTEWYEFEYLFLLIYIIVFFQVGYAHCTHLHYRTAARNCGSPIDWHVEQGVATSNEISGRYTAIYHAYPGSILISYSDVSIIFFSPLWSNTVQMLSFIYY